MTGTAAEVTAITNVDHRPVGAGKMGLITTQLRALYSDAIRAHAPSTQAGTWPFRPARPCSIQLCFETRDRISTQSRAAVTYNTSQGLLRSD